MFEQALTDYTPHDVDSEHRLYAAAKASIGLNAATRVMARIAKRRWRREKTDVGSLLEYLTYLSGYSARHLARDRISAARSYQRVSSILAALVPRPSDVACVHLMESVCQAAVFQYLITDQPVMANAPADLSLRYARAFVLWDKTRAHLLLLPLRQVSKVASVNRDYSRVVECQREVLHIQTIWSSPDRRQREFSLGEVQSPVAELAKRLGMRSHFSLLASGQSLSDAERDAALAFGHRIPFARQLGEDYRLLGQAQTALGATQEALEAFDSSIDMLRSDLASENSRLLALDVALEAIEVTARRGYIAECEKRAKAAIVEAEALKARGIPVPQLHELLTRLQRGSSA